MYNLKPLARDISTAVEEKSDVYFKHNMNVNNEFQSEIEGKRIWNKHLILLESDRDVKKIKIMEKLLAKLFGRFSGKIYDYCSFFRVSNK